MALLTVQAGYETLEQTPGEILSLLLLHALTQSRVHVLVSEALVRLPPSTSSCTNPNID